ncbi:MAG: PKD domain-containing protein [Prevotella sp.]|jgi:hypothetical protein|nr:PKD domain-containing protein [Prevotella sp.]
MMGQGEAAWWYFGYGVGLDFTAVINETNILPTPVNGPISTWEGCFSISDANGNFLLASDGRSVYGGSRTLLAAGTGLKGNDSSTQSGIVIPCPGNINRYFVVTVAAAGYSDGINYSVVDIDAGAVIEKNKPVSINGSGLQMTDLYENITAVAHANNRNYWLAHRSRDKFLLWLVTENGIDSDPIVTDIGHDLGISESANGVKLGYFKFSPDGKHLAQAGGDTGWLTYADFDASTGAITNIKERFISQISSNPLYGLEFSQSGKYLYVAQGWRYNLRAIPTNDFTSGTMTEFTGIQPTALQLGPDGKIYGTSGISPNQNTLWIINDPEEGGNNISTHTSFFSSVGSTGLGLPTFITSFFRDPDMVGDPEACINKASSFSVDIIQGTGVNYVDHIVWDFGDGSSPVIENDMSKQSHLQTHTYTNPGIYTVTIIPYSDATETNPLTHRIQTFPVYVSRCIIPVNPNIHMYNNKGILSP